MIYKLKIYLNAFLMLSAYGYAIASNRIVTTIPVGQTPANLAITPDGKFAYIANNNNYGVANGDSVSVINLATNKVITTIHDASFNQPYTITINHEGTRAYVTNSNSTTITIIDIASNTVIGTIGGFDGPSGMAIMPNGTTAYVNNYGGPDGVGSGNGITVNVVNLSTNTITGTIGVGLAPAAVALSPNGAYLYVIDYVDGNPGTGTMVVVDTSNNTVIRTIHGFSGPFAIAVHPNGCFAYVTNFGSNNFAPIGSTVSVVNLKYNAICDVIPLGIQPAGIAINPNGRVAYVTNYNTLYKAAGFNQLTAGIGTMNIIDLCSNTKLCPEIIVGSSPGAVAVSPDGRRTYVTNFTSNNVSVVNVADKTWFCN